MLNVFYNNCLNMCFHEMLIFYDLLMFVPSWRWFMIEFDTFFAEMEANRKGSTWLKLIQSSGFIWCLPFVLTPSMVFDGMGWKCHEKGLLQK